jgi:hypothetical protein
MITDETVEHLHIPTDYREDDSYNSVSLVMPHYGRTTKQAKNQFRIK